MPAAIAIPGLIGLGTSVAGGIMGSKASKSAAQLQAEAAEREATELQRVIREANPELWKAYEEATGRVTSAASAAQEGVTGATAEANRLLDPYIQAGGTAVTKLGELADEKFQFSQDDPSYQFRLQEGQKALERNRAAMGIISGGRPLKELTRYSQDYASTEYGKAFDRFLQGQQQKAGTLGQLAGFGLNATGTAGSNLIGGARYAGDIGFDAAQFGANAQMNTADKVTQNVINGQQVAGQFRTDAAAAKAAGKVGSANAWTGALGGIARTASDIGGMLTLKDLLKNPALSSSRRRPATFSGWRLPEGAEA